MKKILIVVLIFILFLPININANSKETVTLKSCIDGDTAKFIYNKKEITVRFLAIDTPEVKPNEEPYGKKASDYTCNKLKKAKNIEIEFDNKSNKKDKYDRYLAWIFYNDKLLQEDLVKNGLAKVKYVYDDYKYVEILKEKEKYAKENKKGIYSGTNEISENDLLDEAVSSIKKIGNKLKKEFTKVLYDILDEIL